MVRGKGMGGAGSRSPGRPRQDGRAALTKVDILAAAIPIFATAGYAGASIRDICSAIGAHPSSVFHHFANKEELFSVCYDYVASPYIDLYETIEKTILDPEKAMVVSVYIDSGAVIAEEENYRMLFSLSDIKSEKFPSISKTREKMDNHYKYIYEIGNSCTVFFDYPPEFVSQFISTIVESSLYSYGSDIVKRSRSDAYHITRFCAHALFSKKRSESDLHDFIKETLNAYAIDFDPIEWRRRSQALL